jgi:DNA mismatch repair protein MLH3
VRVKQRAVVVEHNAECNRLWDALRKEATALMLSWRGSIFLKIRDSDNQTALNLNSSITPASTPSVTSIKGKTCSNELQFLLNVLTQSNYITIDDWPGWVPVTASTPSIVIKGAISLEPAPTRRVQFLSLEIQPLSSDAGHNILYDEINRIFALSNFGTVEDDADISETEKIRRRTDKRFKNDGYTSRQLKGRKGVDRSPMFYLRISLKDGRISKGSENRFLENESNLQAVTDVLNAMITQWLSAHHFRPRDRHGKQDRPSTSSTSSTISEIKRQKATLSPGSAVRFSQQTIPYGSLKSGVSERPLSASEIRKRTRSTTSQSVTTSERMQHQSFAEWSRIKSGKAGFFEKLGTSGKQGRQAFLAQEQLSDCVPPSTTLAVFDTDPVLSPQSGKNGTGSIENPHDDTIAWIDPTTKQILILNARTGSVLPETTTRPDTNSSFQSLENIPSRSGKSFRIPPSSVVTEEGKNTWLKGVLQTWDNPIFKPAENRIRQLSLKEPQMDDMIHKHRGHSDCSRIEMDKAFNESSLSSGSNLSRRDLQNAQVIAQLDKKFILVKMVGSSSDREEVGMLVMIDQHAADERVRVEALFAELCAPLPKQHSYSQYHSSLGHKPLVAFTVLEKPLQFTISTQEREQFIRYASRFAAWGIIYDTSTALARMTSRPGVIKTDSILSVATLPPSISERCKASPQLLISLLRTTVWEYTEDPHLPPVNSEPAPLANRDDGSPLWSRRLATCPRGLVDFVNSRACRSAIMFNDELSTQQCVELVSKLSKCVFPFMCAHGRPSMVPLVDMGQTWSKGLGLGLRSDDHVRGDKGFVDAWKQWQKQ